MKTIAALLGLLALQDPVSPDLLEYAPTNRLGGSLEFGPCAGFETVMNQWGDRFKQHHPDLRGARVEPTTGTMPEALIAGTIRYGILGRRWTDAEVEQFRGQWGCFPTWLAVGSDALSIVVHPDNPLKTLSLDQVTTMYAARRRDVKTGLAWGDVGIRGDDWSKVPIRCYVPPKASRSRQAFQLRLLAGGTFREDVREVAAAEDVLSAVSEDPYGVGFVGGVAKPDGVRVVPLMPSPGARGVEPTADSIQSLTYPLSWRVYVAVRKLPGSSVDPDVAEFLKLILSRDGQEILAADGMIPMTGRFARKELQKLK
jgi:phosphate transport system substrate-binding protein